MTALLLLLAIPLISGAALAVDHYARHSATRDEQEFLVLAQRGLGVILAATGLAAMGYVILLENPPRRANADDIGNWLARSAAVLYALFGIVAGVMAEASARTKSANTVARAARAERHSSLFRLLCWSIVLLPLSGFVPPLLIVLPMLVTTIVACWGAFVRGNEASLLWRLAIAMENDLPLADEVTAAAQGATSSRREALLGLADRLRDGRSLADALEVGPRLLPRPTILAIRAAEQTNVLPEILRSAANRSVRDLAEMGGPRDALPFQAYVVNMFGLVMLMAVFLMYWIVPKYRDIFNDFGVELPEVSQQVFRFADGAASFWYLLGPVLLMPMVVILMPSMISMIGWQNLNAPLLMRWFPRRDGPSVLRALAAAVQSSRPLPDVLMELSEHHPRDDMRGRLRRISEMLREGNDSWDILAREGFVRRNEAQALDAAARAGHLPWAMNSLADVSEHSQRVREAWWAEWQRPVMMLFLAFVAGSLCLAMFLPLVRLLNDIAKDIPT